MTSLLEVHALSVGYKDRRLPAVVISSGIDMSLHSGEFVCLLGPNGAGKSTLLRTLAGEQQPLGGSVCLNGQDLHRLSKADLARSISVVLTERVTSSLITVYDLVCMGRLPFTNWFGTLSTRDHEVISESIDAVGVRDLCSKRLSDLSDGERQRCMLARALAQEPKLLILDEVTAFLDLPRRIEMMHRLQQLAHERGVTIVLSTHDLDLALSSADRILLQPKGKALIDAGPEDLVLSGAFESAFESEGLVFDRFSGSFSRPRNVRGHVHLDAHGVEGYWAKRALERRGYVCTLDAQETTPTVRWNEDGSWILITPDERVTHRGLASLIKGLVDSGETSD